MQSQHPHHRKRRSFFTQVVSGVFGLVLLLTIISSSVAYFGLQEISTKVAKQSLLTDATLLNSDLTTRIHSLSSSLQSLALNSLIANALVDNVGREIYLEDFLSGYSSFDGFELKAALSNFEGEIIESNRRDIQLIADKRWLQDIVDNSQTNSLLVEKNGSPVLLVAEPVIFTNTGQAEGALVFQINLGEWLNFSSVKGILTDASPTAVVTLKFKDDVTSQNKTLRQATNSLPSSLVMELPLKLGSTLSSVSITVSATAKQSLISEPAKELMVYVTSASFILLIVAVLLSILVAKKLSAKLISLKQSVSDIKNYSSEGLKYKNEGRDEIDDLSVVFDTVLSDLKDAYKKLSEQSTYKLKESEKFYSSIINNTAEAIVTADEDGCIEIFNPAAERVFGHKNEDIVGKKIAILFATPDSDNSEKESIGTGVTVKNLLSLPADIECLRKNGSRFPAEISISPLITEKRGYVGIFRDISERKLYEHNLNMARLEAEQSSRAKSEFLSSMSHELRTPLNAILGFSQIMQYDNQLSDEYTKYVKEIINAGNHLLGLIEDVLDMAKIEAGKTTINMQTVSLSDLINNSLEMMKSEASNKNIRLTGELSSCEEKYVAADKKRIKQVLLNLLSNAVKYNRPGGEVNVFCKSVKPGRIILSVQDTGDGIADDKLKDLFVPFNRLGLEGSNVKGTGIGLSITKRLVEMMNGVISVETAEKMGTTFHVELDEIIVKPGELLPEPEAVTKTPAEFSFANVSEQNTQVLYIEDDLANIRMMQDLMKHFKGISLICAEDPVSGLELANTIKPDLILLDIQMPIMDGFEVLKLLKAGKKTEAVPVVAVSADAVRVSVEQAKEAGFSDYITKPIDIEQLMKAIGRLVSTA